MTQTNSDSQLSKLHSLRYFAPARSIGDANSLLPKVSEIVEKYVKILMPWKKDNGTLQHASDSLWDLARIEAMRSGCTNTWDFAWNSAWKEASQSARDNYGWYGSEFTSGETVRDAARDAAKYAARYAAFESVKEKLGGNNPFEYVIELYSMGLKPTYFRKIEEQEKFVIDFPLYVDGKNILGCYLHGDKEMSFTHQWIDYCTNLKPVSNPESKRSFA
ncbi:MAG: hypothetical protein KGI02_06010 [Thaumarchaeota archaeon]|nr:hypothetical protein [Nitrososphaerota archaeon]MDE1831912.1 hypothetical protein [Nitrososphaerota archaeon]MDE1840952.1 hypothetical protein [Nitrososphaerota archaeon]MDE1878361.1 hypothetical protein [Nitrososphaerota archaeon]